MNQILKQPAQYRTIFVEEKKLFLPIPNAIFCINHVEYSKRRTLHMIFVDSLDSLDFVCYPYLPNVRIDTSVCLGMDYRIYNIKDAVDYFWNSNFTFGVTGSLSMYRNLELNPCNTLFDILFHLEKVEPKDIKLQPIERSGFKHLDILMID